MKITAEIEDEKQALAWSEEAKRKYWRPEFNSKGASLRTNFAEYDFALVVTGRIPGAEPVKETITKHDGITRDLVFLAVKTICDKIGHALR